MLILIAMEENSHGYHVILVIIIISIASLYGFAIEILQGTVFKERYFEILDIIANNEVETAKKLIKKVVTLYLPLLYAFLSYCILSGG